MSDRIFDILQRLGRSFMLPIAVLPIAGLLLGFGSTFTNEMSLSAYHLQDVMGAGTVFYSIFSVAKNVGQSLFNNIALLFAIGVAIGMAKKEKEIAALGAVIAYFSMNAAISVLLTLHGMILPDGNIADGISSGMISEVCGIMTLQTGVLGGIVVGLGTAYLHNRFHTIEFPTALAFFGGNRFIPIISCIVYIVVGILVFYIWPYVQSGILVFSSFVTKSHYMGTFVFGVIKRALVPLGLHHVFYLPFWQTAVGGTMEVAGKVYEGGQNIFFAQLADPGTTHFSAEACRYFSGEYIFMIFGLPGAALAMYRCARKENRKMVGGILLSATLTSMLTGVTEPLEFTFVFVSPLLYLTQIILAGSCYMIAQMFNITIGLTFSGGLFDFLTFGVLQGNDKTSWMLVIPIGIVYFFLYYITFKVLIEKFDLKTLGRIENDPVLLKREEETQKKEKLRKNLSEAEHFFYLLDGLGGAENIDFLDSCATRLRCRVKKRELVDKESLKQSGNHGMMIRGNNIQLIFGPQVNNIKAKLEMFMKNPNADFDGEDIKADDFLLKHQTHEIIPHKVLSPANGEIIPLSEVNDLVFSSELLGKGCAIIPEEGCIRSPIAGTISEIADTKHAFGIKSDYGTTVLVHIGINTVRLRGEFFTFHVKKGDRVKPGDILITFHYEDIRQLGYSIVTPIIISNTDDCKKISEPLVARAEVGQEILNVE